MNLEGVLNRGHGRRFFAGGRVMALGLALGGAVVTTAIDGNQGGMK